jgi:signal transduction histidine kinase
MTDRLSRRLLRTAAADGLRARVQRGVDLTAFVCASAGTLIELFELTHHASLNTLVAAAVMFALASCALLGILRNVTWTPLGFIGLVMLANLIYLVMFGPWFGLGAVYVLAIALALLFTSPRTARVVGVILVGTPAALGLLAAAGVFHSPTLALDDAWSWGRATLATITALTGIALISHFTIRQLVRERVSIESTLARERTERVERDRVDAELGRARRADAIAQLAAEVGADIGAALAIIRTRANLLAAELHTADARDSLGDIVEAASNAGSTMRQLTAFAPNASNATEHGDGAAAVRALHKLVRRVLPPTITLEISTVDEARVDIGTSDLTRICANLVLNARDAIESTGRITVELTRDATHAMIEVRDTGAGMSDATLGNLFQPFFTTKQLGRGTGLGLATTKILIERARGTIAVTSAIGQGTRFLIRLPLTDGA